MPQVDLLNIPDSPKDWKVYLIQNFRRVADAIAQAANSVGTKDIEITNSSNGIILKSPGGTRYRVTVSNTGVLVVTAV